MSLIKCPECGKMNEKSNVFCPYCFSKFEDEDIIQEDVTSKKDTSSSEESATDDKSLSSTESLSGSESLSSTESLSGSESLSADEKSGSDSTESEKPQINKKEVFAEFYNFIKKDLSLENALEETALKFDIPLSTINNWYTNDAWQKKIDGLEKLKHLREAAYNKLYEIDLDKVSKEDAFNQVAEELKIAPARISKWFDKYKWEDKINARKEEIRKIAEEKKKKQLEKLEHEKKLREQEKLRLQKIYDDKKNEVNSILDSFEDNIKKNLSSFSDDVYYNEDLACSIEKISDEERLFTFGKMDTDFVKKLILRYKMSKGVNKEFSDFSSNFRLLDNNLISLKINVKYIEDNSSFSTADSCKFQYLESLFDVKMSETRKEHEKYFFEIALGDFTRSEFYEKMSKLLDVVEFSLKREKYARASSVIVSEDFKAEFERKQLAEYDNLKSDVFKTIEDLMLNQEKTRSYAVKSAYRKYDIPKKVIVTWYEEEDWGKVLEKSD